MRPILAEFIGTFALVFAGTGAIVINDVAGGPITHVGIALTFGLVVMAMIYSVGDISGAHINPAVTIGFFASGRFSFTRVIPYIVAQLLGALAASWLLHGMFPEHAGLGVTLPRDAWLQAFVLEFVLTFVLMFVILNVSSGSKETGIMAGAAIGGTVALEALFGGPISGASMNPARSLGPTVVSGNYSAIEIYLTATCLGALLAVAVCHVLRPTACCKSDSSQDLAKENQ